MMSVFTFTSSKVVIGSFHEFLVHLAEYLIRLSVSSLTMALVPLHSAHAFITVRICVYECEGLLDVWSNNYYIFKHYIHLILLISCG